MCNKIFLTVGELLTTLGTILVLCEFFYLVALDKMTKKLGQLWAGKQIKSSCIDKFLELLVKYFQKGVNAYGPDIEKEMKIRENMLKVFRIAIIFLILGLTLKVLGIWL